MIFQFPGISDNTVMPIIRRNLYLNTYKFYSGIINFAIKS